MVRFDEYDTLVRVLRRLLINNVHFRDGFSWEDHFQTGSRALIAANHGPIAGPLAWVAAFFPRIVDMGYGHLVYSAIAHPIIRNIPVFARIVGYEQRSGRRLRTADYIDLFKRGRLNILSVAPEGEYSLYGNGVDIQPFRSCRSIEIALRADCQMVLAVARGMEHWHVGLPIESAWRKDLVRRIALLLPFLDRMDEGALAEAGQVSLSWIFGPIRDLYIGTELYEPELTVEELSENPAERDRQLRVEGERMRQEMIRMLDDLGPSTEG